MSSTSVIKVLSEPLQQFPKLAITASVGFHALVFGIVALRPVIELPLDTETVNLLTLSPEEQSRLPEFTTPALPGSDITTGIPSPLPFDGLQPPPLNDFDFGALPPSLVVPSLPLPPPPLDLPSPPDNFSFIPAPLSLPPVIREVEPRVEPSPAGTEPAASASPTSTPVPQPQASPIPAATEPRQAISTLISWLDQVKTKTGENKLSENFRAEAPVTYPLAACKDKLQGRAAVAVLVNPEGQLVTAKETAKGETQKGSKTETETETGTEANPPALATRNPQLILTSKHDLLDQAAIATVKELKFQPTGEYQALMYAFDFRYSETTCQSTPTNQPTPNPQETGGKSSASPSPQASPQLQQPPATEASPTPTPQPSEATSPTPTATESPQSPTPAPSPTQP